MNMLQVPLIISMVKPRQTKISQLQLPPTAEMKYTIHIFISLSLSPFFNQLVVDEDVGALEVTMEEVSLVAEVESLHQLQSEALDVLLCELHHPTLQQTHQVVVTVLKHQVE